MEVKQICELVNSSTKEVLGETAVLNEDLTNVVEIGTAIFNANALDNYVKELINHIGRVIFVTRPYQGIIPSVLMESWEFGSILEKVSTGLPVAQINEDWQLEDNTSYDPNIFYKPSVMVKFYNNKVTFTIPMSFTEMQVKESFSNREQLNSFISMLYMSVENSLTIKVDNLIMKTINNFIAETIQNEYQGGDLTVKSGVKAVNLLFEYNTFKGTTLKASECLTDMEFLKYASYKIKLTYDRMTKMSTLFNIGAQPRFTPKEDAHIVMLTDFKSGADIYLQSDTFHNEFTSLPTADIVPFWQGSGVNYEFEETSKIDVKSSNNNTVSTSGILSVIFDRNALGVNNYNRRVTSNYNPVAEFYTNWYKTDGRYFNDFNENFVVFFVA